MEVLTPLQSEPEIRQENQDVPQDLLDAGITIRNVEILDYLGLKESMFDPRVMNKVEEISQLLGERDLMDLDVMLGNDRGMTKIDKIYTYLKLDAQTRELRRREEMLEQEKNRFI